MIDLEGPALLKFPVLHSANLKDSIRCYAGRTDAQRETDFSGQGRGSVVTMELGGKIKSNNPFMPIIYSEHIYLVTLLK